MRVGDVGEDEARPVRSLRGQLDEHVELRCDPIALLAGDDVRNKPRHHPPDSGHPEGLDLELVELPGVDEPVRLAHRDLLESSADGDGHVASVLEDRRRTGFVHQPANDRPVWLAAGDLFRIEGQGRLVDHVQQRRDAVQGHQVVRAASLGDVEAARLQGGQERPIVEGEPGGQDVRPSIAVEKDQVDVRPAGRRARSGGGSHRAMLGGQGRCDRRWRSGLDRLEDDRESEDGGGSGEPAREERPPDLAGDGRLQPRPECDGGGRREDEGGRRRLAGAHRGADRQQGDDPAAVPVAGHDRDEPGQRQAEDGRDDDTPQGGERADPGDDKEMKHDEDRKDRRVAERPGEEASRWDTGAERPDPCRGRGRDRLTHRADRSGRG